MEGWNQMSEDWSYVCDEIGKSTKEGSKTFDKPRASSCSHVKNYLFIVENS